MDDIEVVETKDIVVVKSKKKITRDFEELQKVSIKNMSEVELQKYVNQLRSNLNQAEHTINSYLKNCEGAYAKVRELDEKYIALQSEFTRKLYFAKQQISACYSAITLLKVEE